METKIVNGVSKKTGKAYYAIDVYITDSYKKRVFLTPAEVELIKLQNNMEGEY